MKKTHIFTAFMLVLTSAFTQAQETATPQTAEPAPTPAQQSNINIPPPSNLGQQVPTVVYPSPTEITQETITDLRNVQFTDEQWEELKQIYLQREQQRSQPYPTAPKPITRSLIVNLDAGVSPPIIRLARGQQSSIVFSDMAGNPWFVERVVLNRTAFSDGRANNEITKDERPTNVITIEPMSISAYGNVTVTLRGLSTPVIFMLLSGQGEVDLRVDAKISGNNPDQPTPNISYSNAPSIDNSLAYFLDGVPPKDAVRLRVTGMNNIDAWLFQNELYVRTRSDVLYPAFMSSAKSTTGLSIYKFSQLFPAVTLSSGGQAITIQIERQQQP